MHVSQSCLAAAYMRTMRQARIMQILLEDGLAEDGCIAVTQPRRVVRFSEPGPYMISNGPHAIASPYG